MSFSLFPFLLNNCLLPSRSPEERAEMEAETASAPSASTANANTTPLKETEPSSSNLQHDPTPTFVPTANPAAPGNQPSTSSPASQSLQHHLSSTSGSPTPAPASSATQAQSASEAAKKGKKPTLTAEQQKKLLEMEAAKEKARVERVEVLQKKLIDRIRPFVEAKKPGDKDDEETKRFVEAMRREADDLKLESFGVEVCWFRCFLIRDKN